MMMVNGDDENDDAVRCQMLMSFSSLLDLSLPNEDNYKRTSHFMMNSMVGKWVVGLLLAFLVQFTDGSHVGGSTSSARSRSRKPTSSHTPCNGVPTVSVNRRACNFFIWDAPSALFYKWCHHLLKDNIYEGRGGQKFVRYESNSVFQLLYPCSQYSPNRCLVCGGSYPDHLELWWSKHMYTPYDRHLDKTYNDALVVNENQNKKSKRSQKSAVEVTGPPIYAFHRRYVLDVSNWIRGIPEKEEKIKSIQQRLVKEKSWSGNSRLRFMKEYPSAAYAIPDIVGDDKKQPSVTLRAVRAIVMSNLDDLLFLQEKENEKLRDPY